MTGVLQHNGEPVFFDGYCAIWGTLSDSVADLGNLRSLFLPGAFSDVLNRPSPDIQCRPHHAGPGAVLGSVGDGNLVIWADDYGLAFRCGPVPATAAAVSVAREIVSGTVRGASTRDVVGKQEIRMIDGEEVVVVHRVKSLLHLGPVYVPQNPDTIVWCSHLYPYDLPDHMRPLARHWHAHRPAARSARAVAPGIAMVDIYPAGFGLSSPELEESAFIEVAGRRAHNEARARQHARQRERNRAICEARAT